MGKTNRQNRYQPIIERVFFEHFEDGIAEFEFDQDELWTAFEELGVRGPNYLSEIPNSFRFRTVLPTSISDTAPDGHEWIIRPAGTGKYRFCLTQKFEIVPNPILAETKILDATPGIIRRYALNDEQALLAIVRFNRLIDIFTGLTCYSLQNHLRTTVAGMGQVETDEMYIGLDKCGVQYVLPVQAKGKTDRLGIVQIEQDFAMSAQKFPVLTCKAIAAQFMVNGAVALFEFESSIEGIALLSEKHYRLVTSAELSDEELETYKSRRA